jgi:hypothetical protein
MHDPVEDAATTSRAESAPSTQDRERHHHRQSQPAHRHDHRQAGEQDFGDQSSVVHSISTSSNVMQIERSNQVVAARFHRRSARLQL